MKLIMIMATFCTEVELWDVIAELVLLSTFPSPANPFAVDMDYCDSLPVPERLLTTAAMLNVLLCILDSGPHSYDKRSIINTVLTVYPIIISVAVHSDVLRVGQCHFHALLEIQQPILN